MSTKHDRLLEVYDHLRNNNGVHTQTDLASSIHITRPAMSAAMNGNEAYLTKNLFQKICAAFPGVFNLDYLLTGIGSLLSDEQKEESNPKQFDLAAMMSTFERQLKAKDNQIAWLQSQIEDLQSQLRRLTTTRPQPYGTLVADSEFTEVK